MTFKYLLIHPNKEFMVVQMLSYRGVISWILCMDFVVSLNKIME